jgi:hypothetical protein
VLAGIMLFLWAGAPSGGTAQPSASLWWVACLGTLVLVTALMLFGIRLTGASKALLLGSAAGFAFGLQAAVTKTFVGEVGHGVMSLLADWSVYVLVASALVGFVLQQGSLKIGVLAPAIASSNAVTLFSHITLVAATQRWRSLRFCSASRSFSPLLAGGATEMSPEPAQGSAELSLPAYTSSTPGKPQS